MTNEPTTGAASGWDQACFTADLAAIVGEEPPVGITATGFIDLAER